MNFKAFAAAALLTVAGGAAARADLSSGYQQQQSAFENKQAICMEAYDQAQFSGVSVEQRHVITNNDKVVRVNVYGGECSLQPMGEYGIVESSVVGDMRVKEQIKVEGNELVEYTQYPSGGISRTLLGLYRG